MNKDEMLQQIYSDIYTCELAERTHYADNEYAKQVAHTLALDVVDDFKDSSEDDVYQFYKLWCES